MNSGRNPIKEQDRVFDLYDTFNKYGYVMFRQQRAIYTQIAQRLHGKMQTVLEFGCGNGVGTAILEKRSNVSATDISQRNVDFASELYPWINFSQWDICQLWMGRKAQIVVAIEVLEHVADSLKALSNLMDAAYEEVWISTPNGIDKPRPPSNPYHVCEYNPIEICEMVGKIGGFRSLKMYNWETFEEIKETNTPVDPLVYRITKK